MRKVVSILGLSAAVGGMLLAAPAAYGDPFGLKDAAKQVADGATKGASDSANKVAADAVDSAAAPVKDAQADAAAAAAAAEAAPGAAVDAQKKKALDTTNDHVGKATGGMLKVQEPE